MRSEIGHQGDAAKVHGLLRLPNKKTLVARSYLISARVIEARLDLIGAALQPLKVVLKSRLPLHVFLIGDFGVAEARLRPGNRGAIATRKHQRQLLELQRM